MKIKLLNVRSAVMEKVKQVLFDRYQWTVEGLDIYGKDRILIGTIQDWKLSDRTITLNFDLQMDIHHLEVTV